MPQSMTKYMGTERQSAYRPENKAYTGYPGIRRQNNS